MLCREFYLCCKGGALKKFTTIFFSLFLQSSFMAASSEPLETITEEFSYSVTIETASGDLSYTVADSLISFEAFPKNFFIYKTRGRFYLVHGGSGAPPDCGYGEGVIWDEQLKIISSQDFDPSLFHARILLKPSRNPEIINLLAFAKEHGS